MRKFSVIVIVSVVLIISGLLLVSSNFNSLSDARKVRIGMPVDSLTTIMGEPFQIEVNQDNEYWHFKYIKSIDTNICVMRVKIVNDTVGDFYSY